MPRKRVPVPNHELGAKRGLATRVSRSDDWSWSVIAAIEAVGAANADRLGALRQAGKPLERPFTLGELTNDQLAERIKQPPFNIAAPRGGELSGKDVHNAFDRVGISNALVKRWRKQAFAFATELDVNSQLVVFQLWHEWKRHEATNDKLARSLNERAAKPFKPRFVPPDEWVPPWVRAPDPELKLPRLAMLALSLGLFEPSKEEWREERERAKGEEARHAAGDLGGHPDDTADYLAYSAKVDPSA